MIGELIKRNSSEGKKNYPIIHWQTGEPKKNGFYLLTLKNGVVCIDYLGHDHVWKRTSMIRMKKPPSQEQNMYWTI